MHGGITKIALPSSTIWTPDMFLWNSISEEFYSLYDMDLTLTHDGLGFKTKIKLTRKSFSPSTK